MANPRRRCEQMVIDRSAAGNSLRECGFPAEYRYGGKWTCERCLSFLPPTTLEDIFDG